MIYSFCSTWPWLCWEESTNSQQNPTFVVTLISVLLLLLWRFKKSSNIAALPPPLPPGPLGLPFVGYLPFLGSNPHLKFDELARSYGPIFKVMLGTKTYIVISSPLLVKEVVRDQDSIFANRDPPISASIALYGGINIASLPYGPEWRKARKILVRELLSNTNIRDSFYHRKAEVKKCIIDVYEKKRGCPVNIGELAFLTATSSIMSMVWGETLRGEEGTAMGAQFRSLVSELMVLIGTPNVSDLYPALAWLDLQGIEKKTRKVFEWIDRLLESAIRKRMNVTENGENKSEKKDFLQYLLELTKSDDGDSASMTRDEIKAILLDTVVGGTETTSTTLEWVVARLLQCPEAMKRVHQELDAVVGLDNCIESESQLSKLKYLEAVIKETLRLHPILPFLIPRCPSQTSTVSGYAIPKGAQVLLNMWTIHRDNNIWDDALEFRPERFLSDDAGNLDYSGNNFKYLPFGSGRRVCAGLSLGEKMVMFMLASFLHSFEWTLPRGTELDFQGKFGIVIKKLKPLVVVPKPRLSKPELYQ